MTPVRLQLHTLAYNLGNFMRTLAAPEPIRDWPMTTLREKLIKIGAKVVGITRYVAFQMAEVVYRSAAATNYTNCIVRLDVVRLIKKTTTGEVCLDDRNFRNFHSGVDSRQTQGKRLS